MKKQTDFTLGQQIKVEGISVKGKHRIKEHGNLWLVSGFNSSMNKLGIISSTTSYKRWVQLNNNEKDFKIV